MHGEPNSIAALVLIKILETFFIGLWEQKEVISSARSIVWQFLLDAQAAASVRLGRSRHRESAFED